MQYKISSRIKNMQAEIKVNFGFSPSNNYKILITNIGKSISISSINNFWKKHFNSKIEESGNIRLTIGKYYSLIFDRKNNTVIESLIHV